MSQASDFTKTTTQENGLVIDDGDDHHQNAFVLFHSDGQSCEHSECRAQEGPRSINRDAS